MKNDIVQIVFKERIILVEGSLNIVEVELNAAKREGRLAKLTQVTRILHPNKGEFTTSTVRVNPLAVDYIKKMDL